MHPSEALSKLHEIFRVLIGDCVDEWQTQKQQTPFSTDYEWTQHLLLTHRRCCNDINCKLFHTSNSSIIFKTTPNTEDSSDTGTQPSRTTKPSRSGRLNLRTRANRKSYAAHRRRSTVIPRRHASAAISNTSSHTPTTNLLTDSSRDHRSSTDSVKKTDEDISYENTDVQPNNTKESVERQSVVESAVRPTVKQEVDDVVVLGSDDDDDDKEPAVDDHDQSSYQYSSFHEFPRSQTGPDDPGDVDAWPTISTLSSTGQNDNFYTVVSGDESWQITASSEVDLMDSQPSDTYQSQQYVIKEEAGGVPEESDIGDDQKMMFSPPPTSSDRANLARFGQPTVDRPISDLSSRQKAFMMNRVSSGHVCDVCGYVASSVSYLRDHKNAHWNIRPHTCDICGSSFTRSGTLYNHKLKHKNQVLTCSVCSWTTTSFRSFHYHCLQHRNADSQQFT